jgi:Kdo2-lipid IVA lauroyltransferase/acyltransferase
MASCLRGCRNLAEYLLFLPVYALVRGLRAESLGMLVVCLSRLLYCVLVSERRWCQSNLELVYGEQLTRAERERLGRRAFANLVRTRVELLRWTPEWMAAHVHGEGLDHVRQALGRGKGTIVVSGHLGNFELIGAHLVAQGCPLAWIHRPLNNWRLDRILFRSRLRYVGAAGVIRNAHTLVALRAALRRGHVVALAMDLNTLDRPIFVDFLGFAAASPAGAAILALSTKAPVIFAAAIRAPDGRHRIAYHPPFHLIEGGDRERDVAANLQQYTRALERYVLVHPEQYHWSHPRWQRRPDGSAWSLRTPPEVMAAERIRPLAA